MIWRGWRKPLPSFILLLLLASPIAHGFEQIIKPYQSARSSGMGGVKLLTGLWDENFFGNPARTSANPRKRVQLFDLMLETSSSTISNVSAITSGSGSTLSKVAATSGKNNHARIQTCFPGFYWSAGGKWNYAMAFLASEQLDFNLRNSYRVDPSSVLDMGPAISASRKLLRQDQLVVGATLHLNYRLSTKSNYGLTDLIQGASLSPSKAGAEHGQFDFDMGSTYRLPREWKDWTFNLGASIQQLLGGRYQNISVKWVGLKGVPRQQPRTYGFGGSMEREQLWIFNHTVLAMEFQDIGNNPDGSLFRTLHIGGETHWKGLKPRLGINQGYWAAGLGFEWRALELELASYGEELSLNVGGVEDRRYLFRLSVAI